MASKKPVVSDETLSMFSGMRTKAKEQREKTRTTPAFKKPRSDYYNLDMIVRDTTMGSKGHPIITEGIRKNYKEYISTMASAEGLSITKYIHKLIDEDMERNEKQFKALRKARKT